MELDRKGLLQIAKDFEEEEETYLKNCQKRLASSDCSVFVQNDN